MLDVLEILDSTEYPKYSKHYVLDVLDVLDGIKYPKYPKHYPWQYMLALCVIMITLPIRS